jgi:hypothetical protein
MFKLKSKVLATDRDIFDTPVSDLLTLPPGEISKWITSQRPIILHSRREAHRCSATQTRLLPTYFHPLRRSSHQKRQSRHQKLRPTDLDSSPPDPYMYDDTFDTLMTEHFSRLPTVRARKKKPARPPPSRRKLHQQPLLPCPDHPT